LGKTISEKIFQAHSGRECKAGDMVVAKLDFCMTHDSNRPPALDIFHRFGGETVFDARKVAYVIDHHTPAPQETSAKVHQKIRAFCAQQGIQLYENEGICHQLLPEKGHIIPGDLIIGSDSHTCTYGALNAFATGVGITDLAASLLAGELWFKVPPTIRIQMRGMLPRGTLSKDLILFLMGQMTAGGATYEAVEFGGETIMNLSVDSRLTIANMAIEMGAKAGIMEADEKLRDWLQDKTARPWEPVLPDRDAEYVKWLDFDLSGLGPQVAKPHTVDNVVPIEEIGHVPIHMANLASCTNGRLEDLAIAAEILKGRKVHPQVRFHVVPASRSVFLEAMRTGILSTLMEAGGVVRNPSCACCNGGAAFGVPAPGEVVISSANRNFKGRLGNPEASIYLASPATVAASALEGKIVDCREYLGGST
jgi:3-isopropylmalate/(R)-2-methylmalate dehydratase large subunit